MLLEIGIEQFAGIEFRRVTGQIKDLDFVHILRQPLLNDLGVMHTKVVDDEEYLLRPPVWLVWRFPGTVHQAICLPLAETVHRLSLTAFAARIPSG
jgi:hypothetical protein